MAGVLLDMAISLDGCVSGPGGADAGLYDWYFEPSATSAPIVEELVRTTGAICSGCSSRCGRNAPASRCSCTRPMRAPR